MCVRFSPGRPKNDRFLGRFCFVAQRIAIISLSCGDTRICIRCKRNISRSAFSNTFVALKILSKHQYFFHNFISVIIFAFAVRKEPSVVISSMQTTPYEARRLLRFLRCVFRFRAPLLFLRGLPPFKSKAFPADGCKRLRFLRF